MTLLDRVFAGAYTALRTESDGRKELISWIGPFGDPSRVIVESVMAIR
jgi:hypothetical protein